MDGLLICSIVPGPDFSSANKTSELSANQKPTTHNMVLRMRGLKTLI